MPLMPKRSKFRKMQKGRLKEVAKEISTMSSGSEGNSYSVLKVI